MKYSVNFYFLSQGKILLGLDFTRGVERKTTGEYRFNELSIGFIFFFVAITKHTPLEDSPIDAI